MRLNIEIDDELLSEAMAATGLATRKATVEAALRLVVSQKRRREALRSTAGIGWDGDLEAMRRDGPAPAS
jgi:Arc/MetJ family transcription regulator